MNKTLSIFIITIFSIIQSSYSFAGDDGKLKLNQGNGNQYEVKDCFEKVNRGIFAFNQVLDKAIFRPLAKDTECFLSQ